MKKLILLSMLGCAGTVLAEELSPFGSSPFSHGFQENPFQNKTAVSAPFPVSQESSMQEHAAAPVDAMYEESPFTPKQRTVLPEGSFPEHSTSHVNSESAVDDQHADVGEDLLLDKALDTSEQESSGNWLLKRIWWEKTEPVYEEIKRIFNEIMNVRLDYIAQRNRFDRELDVAYGQIGLEEGELQDIIDGCLAFAKKEKTENDFLTPEEAEFYKAVQHKQHDLEQVKLDMQALQEVDKKIDEALDTLFQQIDVANQYEQKAWENFKDIARELNDKVARTSYYETEGLLKDIQAVHAYITSQFSSYFTQTIQSARNHLQNITSQVQSLKQSGVDLKKRVEALEQAQETARIQKEVAAQEKKQPAPEKKSVPQKEEGLVTTIVDAVTSVTMNVVTHIKDAFISLGSWVKGWFVKEEVALRVREKGLAQKVVTEQKQVNESVDKAFQVVEQSVQHAVDHPQETVSAIAKSGEQAFEKVEQAVKKDFNQIMDVVHSEDPFNQRQNTRSVMPQEPAHNPVHAFGPPPSEHEQTQAQTHSNERSLSPFVRK